MLTRLVLHLRREAKAGENPARVRFRALVHRKLIRDFVQSIKESVDIYSIFIIPTIAIGIVAVELCHELLLLSDQ